MARGKDTPPVAKRKKGGRKLSGIARDSHVAKRARDLKAAGHQPPNRKNYNKRYFAWHLAGDIKGGPPILEMTDEGRDLVDDMLSGGRFNLTEVCTKLGVEPRQFRRLVKADAALRAIVEDARVFGVHMQLSTLATSKPDNRDSAAGVMAQLNAVTRYAEVCLPKHFAKRVLHGDDPHNPPNRMPGVVIVPMKEISTAKAKALELAAGVQPGSHKPVIEAEARLVLPTPKGA